MVRLGEKNDKQNDSGVRGDERDSFPKYRILKGWGVYTISP
jgi:hypothetical protein